MTRSPLRVHGIRVAAVALVLSACWYVPWLLTTANWRSPLIAVPFVAANLLVVVSTIVTSINNWQRAAPEPHPVTEGAEPEIAVIIPTCGEPAAMVMRTASSVIGQDWPAARLTIVVSDDAASRTMALATTQLRHRHPQVDIIYHVPPPTGDASRRGDAKAGNLNSVLDLLDRSHDHVRYIETRDADDEVGDRRFLRETVGQLEADTATAYVQTVKRARVGAGDPFGNNDPLFYEGAMYARHAANAVFPCGSGLVWRRRALADIGGFPTWNLVEDLQSGVEALRRGWRSCYLPIVGAMGQVAPEDIPNVYKQRGTWALDTLRLLLYSRKRGLTVRQRLHFLELGLFYCLGPATIVLLICPTLALTVNMYPLVTTHTAYTTRFWPFAISVEVLLAALATGHRYETLWRARQMWVGMAPVYTRACLMALRYGRSRKPSYTVTRKTTEQAWYWRQTLPQGLLVGAFVVSLAYRAATSSVLRTLDLGSAYWGGFAGLFMLGFIRKSWYGVAWRDAIAARWAARTPPFRRDRPATGAAAPSHIVDVTDDRHSDTPVAQPAPVRSHST
ncbi:hypothetical protein BH23ACT10_BH23ACT10_32380 [soil metagenome]